MHRAVLVALVVSSSVARADDIPQPRSALHGPNGTRYRIVAQGDGDHPAEGDLVTYRLDVYWDNDLARQETEAQTTPLAELGELLEGEHDHVRAMRSGEVRIIWGRTDDCRMCDHFTKTVPVFRYVARLALIQVQPPSSPAAQLPPPPPGAPSPAKPCVFPEIADSWAPTGCATPLQVQTPSPKCADTPSPSHRPSWPWLVVGLGVLVMLERRIRAC